MEDEKIVDLFLIRNENAIRHTSQKYGSRLRNMSFRITEDELTAQECENDTYTTSIDMKRLEAFFGEKIRALDIAVYGLRLQNKKDEGLI